MGFRARATPASDRQRRELSHQGILHPTAEVRAGALNLNTNPITTVLAGPVGTGPGGWPSAFRGVGATPPAHVDLREEVKPIEQHGFTLADFLPDRIVLRMFEWDINGESTRSIASNHFIRPNSIARRSE